MRSYLALFNYPHAPARASNHRDIHLYIHTYIHACMHAYMCIHICIHTVHTYIYIASKRSLLPNLSRSSKTVR